MWAQTRHTRRSAGDASRRWGDKSTRGRDDLRTAMSRCQFRDGCAAASLPRVFLGCLRWGERWASVLASRPFVGLYKVRFAGTLAPPAKGFLGRSVTIVGLTVFSTTRGIPPGP